MNVIRVTGNTKNRIDAIFTGSKYLFFSQISDWLLLQREYQWMRTALTSMLS